MKFKKIEYVIGFIYPKDWRVIPWIDSCPCPFSCGSFQFTWLFLMIRRIDLSIFDEELS